MDGGGFPAPTPLVTFRMETLDRPGPRPDWDLSSLSLSEPTPSLSLNVAGAEELECSGELPGIEPALKSYRSPIFWSVLLHLAVLFLFIGGLYGMDTRPVREVNHWVVNLASVFKEEPQGPQAGLREDLSLLTRPFRPSSEPPAPPLQERENLPPREAIPFEEFPGLPPEMTNKEISGESPLTPSPPEEKTEDNALYALNESAAPQARMGQYLFQMKMGDPMVAFKMRYLQKNLRDQVLGLVRTRMGEERANPPSAEFALVEISYDEKGLVKNVVFSPDSQERITDLFKDFDWKSLVSPGNFGLPFKTTKIRMGVDSGHQVTVNVSFL